MNTSQKCRITDYHNYNHEEEKSGTTKEDCRLLVIGGGTGGCSVAAKFASKLGKNRVIVIDPADNHYYQAMFTMIGAGAKKLSESHRPMKQVLPADALWLKEKVTEIDPQKNQVRTENGSTVEYDFMIPGLFDALNDPQSGVCSNYSPLYVTKTFQCMKQLKSGNAIFTYPNSPVKCAGAPQKIAYLTAHHAQKNGKTGVQVIYHTSLPVIFKCPKYADSLWKVVKQKNVQVHLNSDLYEMLHVTPPQYPSPLISLNKQLSDASGFLAVNKDTLQHVKFPNIFAGQLGVLRKNLKAAMESKDPKAAYDGYTSCPLVTGYGTCIMAEFDYDCKPLETFPFDQGVERRTMYHMKKDIMPILYFQLMLR
ncbi:Sulfide:quinone oxidoreductase [Blattella germanica]|nr:Sulfide:quinone oxidoreductase [Blattella germanica]